MAKNETVTEAAETETKTYAYAVKSGRHVRFEDGKRVVYSPKPEDENVMELTEAQAKPFGKSIERIASPTSRTGKSSAKSSSNEKNEAETAIVNGIPDAADKFIEMIEAEEDVTKLATYEKHEHERSGGPRKTVLAAIADQRKSLK